MELYFVRHGESVANRTRAFANSGSSHHPLTPRGIKQAQRLTATLSSTSIARIYSSPLLRAVQTADILAQTMQAPIEVAEALREWVSEPLRRRQWQASIERATALARQALGEEAWAAAYAAGQAMTLEEAVAAALEETQGR